MVARPQGGHGEVHPCQKAMWYPASFHLLTICLWGLNAKPKMNLVGCLWHGHLYLVYALCLADKILVHSTCVCVQIALVF
jgi:hypothetical protein